LPSLAASRSGLEAISPLRPSPAAAEQSDEDWTNRDPVVERRDGIVYKCRDGKIVRLDYYDSRQQALEAVGRQE